MKDETWILNYIPTGSENAITRKELSIMTGICDRDIRKSIHIARRYIPILNLSDGKGYYIPNMNNTSDKQNLKIFFRQEENRIKSIGWALKAARRTLRNCNEEAL